jgi:hypothetical protein
MSAQDNKYNRNAKGRARYARYRASAKGQANELRQHDRHNPKRIFIGRHYVGTESKFPYPREVVERHLFGLADEFRQGQAEEYDAFRAKLDDEAVPARLTELTNEQLAKALLPPPTESNGSRKS